MSEQTQGSRSLILWGVGTPRTLRPHWAMAELGLDYECRAIQTRSSAMQTPEFLGLTARKKIPLLQDGAFTLTESAAIIAYLSDAYGDERTALLPADAQARAQCLEWCVFVLSELDAGSLYVIRRHHYLPQIYGEAPEACASAARYFADQMPSVQRQLDKGHSFLLGDRLSAADIMLTSCLTWAVRFGVGIPEIAVAYAARITARTAYAQAVARNTPPAASSQA
jgi:glutathione S-transferase